MADFLGRERKSGVDGDMEKESHSFSEEAEGDIRYYQHPFMRKLLSWGVEARGTLIQRQKTFVSQ